MRLIEKPDQRWSEKFLVFEFHFLLYSASRTNHYFFSMFRYFKITIIITRGSVSNGHLNSELCKKREETCLNISNFIIER